GNSCAADLEIISRSQQALILASFPGFFAVRVSPMVRGCLRICRMTEQRCNFSALRIALPFVVQARTVRGAMRGPPVAPLGIIAGGPHSVRPTLLLMLPFVFVPRLRWNGLCHKVAPRSTHLPFTGMLPMTGAAWPNFLLAAADGHAGESLGAQLPLATVFPFVAMLLSIALFPLFAGHWWER